jgi:hypothetical protein
MARASRGPSPQVSGRPEVSRESSASHQTGRDGLVPYGSSRSPGVLFSIYSPFLILRVFMRRRLNLPTTIIFLALILALHVNALAQETAFPCDEKDAIHRWQGNGYQVIVCGFGGTPKQIKKNWWRGNGLVFYKITPTKKTLIRMHSEYYPEMDYFFHGNSLIFVIYTYKPKKAKGMFDRIPFIKETVRLSRNKTTSDKKLLMKKPEPDPNEVNAILSTLKLQKQQFMKKYPSIDEQGHAITYSLYMLRNYGLLDPVDISKRLSRLEFSWWNDGEGGETYRDVQAELKIIESLSKQ